jgi:hypothetical protein
MLPPNCERPRFAAVGATAFGHHDRVVWSYSPIRVACVAALLAGCGSSNAGETPSGGSDAGGDGMVTTPGPDGGSAAEASAGNDAATEAAPSGGDAGMSKDGATDGGMTVPIVPAFYVATNGNDSNYGSLASPFATLGRAQTAMQGSSSIKTTYVRAGSYQLPTIASCGGSSCGLNLVAARRATAPGSSSPYSSARPT